MLLQFAASVTLFSLLLGTGLDSALSRRLGVPHLSRFAALTLAGIALAGVVATALVTPLISWAITFERPARIALAIVTLVPVGMVLGIPMPAGIRLLRAQAPEMMTRAWGDERRAVRRRRDARDLHRDELRLPRHASRRFACLRRGGTGFPDGSHSSRTEG
jgi:hypothetical protein